MSRPLWTCPACGRTFARRDQTHTCAALGELDRHFEGCDPVVRELFDLLRSRVEPVSVLPEKTRIAFHLRMSFAAFAPHRHWLDGHLVLARRAAHPAVRRVEVYSRRNVLHAFRLTGREDVDAGFLGLLAEAREVGEQRHLEA
jgi:uncharacterized protein DUF5655